MLSISNEFKLLFIFINNNIDIVVKYCNDRAGRLRPFGFRQLCRNQRRSYTNWSCLPVRYRTIWSALCGDVFRRFVLRFRSGSVFSLCISRLELWTSTMELSLYVKLIFRATYDTYLLTKYWDHHTRITITTLVNYVLDFGISIEWSNLRKLHSVTLT